MYKKKEQLSSYNSMLGFCIVIFLKKIYEKDMINCNSEIGVLL